MIEVLEPGPLTTVQDAGRNGFAALGVPRSGAFDLAAMRVANRLVGNRPDAAVLEITLGGLVVRFLDAATVATTGAHCPGFDERAAVSVPAGTVVRLGAPRRGLRTYLAVRGGIDAVPVLHSRSTDALSGIGPPPLRPGDRVAVGTAIETTVAGVAATPGGSNAALRLLLGPRDEWFTADAVRLLAHTTWVVRPESNRIGIRLDGAALPRSRTEELPSEPTLPGAVQVPADGRPILFGPDAPTTGGYPVVGVVPRADLDRAAQARPGDALRFVVSRTTDAAPRRTAPPPPPPPGS